MRLILHFHSLLSVVVWNAVLQPAATASPWLVNTPPSPSLPFQLPRTQDKIVDHRAFVTRIRDGIIQSVWGLSSRIGLEGCAKPASSRMSRPPPTMLARYGGDAVLRFHIRQKEDAKALAEAVNVLFLDVWEFNTEWVDIRLAKDVVCCLVALLGKSSTKSCYRFYLYWDYFQRLYKSHILLSCMILLRLFSNPTPPIFPMTWNNRLIIRIAASLRLFERHQMRQTFFSSSISHCPSSCHGYGSWSRSFLRMFVLSISG